MTRIIALVFIAQFICLSQSAQVKRAPDACAGSNNKSSTSSDYAYLSKRTSGDSDFSKPKYQSIYAKNTSVNNTTKRGKSITREEQTSTPTTVPTIGKRENTTPTVKEEKNKTSKAIREPEIEDEFIEPTSSEKKVEISKPMDDVIQTEKVVVAESKPEIILEEGKIASSPKESSRTKKSEKNASKSVSSKSSDLKTTKATKQKQQKKGTAKKLRLGKKCATDCPEF